MFCALPGPDSKAAPGHQGALVARDSVLVQSDVGELQHPLDPAGYHTAQGGHRCGMVWLQPKQVLDSYRVAVRHDGAEG